MKQTFILVTSLDEYVSHISTGSSIRTQSSSGFSIGCAFRTGVSSALFLLKCKGVLYGNVLLIDKL